MKRKTFLQTIPLTIGIILAFCVASQFANGQCPIWFPCNKSGTKVRLCNNYQSICVPKKKVDDYLAQGWSCCLDISKANDNELSEESSAYSFSPNPIPVLTAASFTIDQEENVFLKIFDLHGRLISTLVDAEMDKGPHEINWEASDVTAEIYFLQLQSSEFLQTVKFAVAK